MNEDYQARLDAAKDIARAAGELALGYFARLDTLDVRAKATQDHVSEADLEVETLVRARLAAAFPDDGVVGEEHADVAGTSGFTWVIDPIDGTANFIRGIPAWCVAIACIHEDRTVVGVVHGPSNDEMFFAVADGRACVNGRPIRVAASTGLNDGSVGVGMNNRTTPAAVVRLIEQLVGRGGIFFRNASGALMLAYVAAGRLIGYTEPHMNAWDCLAGQLLVAQAGGRVEDQSATAMVQNGGRVIVATPAIFDELVAISDTAYSGVPARTDNR